MPPDVYLAVCPPSEQGRLTKETICQVNRFYLQLLKSKSRRAKPKEGSFFRQPLDHSHPLTELQSAVVRQYQVRSFHDSRPEGFEGVNFIHRDRTYGRRLGGQLKTGQRGSLQNRPTGVAQDVILFIPLSLDRASLIWSSSSAVRISGCGRDGAGDAAWR